MNVASRISAIAVLLAASVVASHAGGPAFIAGSGYDPGVEGQAVIWANGAVQYFTDLGDLSPILPGAQADAFVAAAFTTWTTIAGVALSASQAGHLAEDVNGSNIGVDDGVITAPADITSSATGDPVGIVYDYDGTVTDALLGQGAGGLDDCFTNAVYGGPDNFSTTGNIVHAFVVINGVCAAATAQLPDVQYRLVRVLGGVVGMGWSQANLNVITRQPPPGSDDFAGFPVMHFEDPISCVPIAACYPAPATLKMDDITAAARLYPGVGNPQATGRIYGSVYFTDSSGNAVQPMQGVNVVARLMVLGQPSRQYVATSVSGFAFHGNAGNIIDGYTDANGLRFDRWGSDDPSLEGFFDLGQLTIPTGHNIAEYQLSVEAVDANWSLGVEPYAPTQVAVSGTFAPVVVTIESGSNVERDILMLQNEIATEHPGSGSTYTNPVVVPQGGAWGSWISGYGSSDWFEFTAQANRTASVSVTALDESGQPSETKLLPVIGIWQASDQSGNPAPASTPSAFNTVVFGMSRLDAQFSVSDTFKVGVADYRGDGRPDYFYLASLLYSDTITPPRLSLAGGVTTLNGTGFQQQLQVTVDDGSTTTLAASASQILVAVPSALQDGTASIEVMDLATGGFSQMIDALTYGAAATDLLLLLQGGEPATPVGSQSANPIRVRAVAADGVTPVNGATIAWSATNGLQFSACGGTSSCSVLSDEAGEALSWVTPAATGASTVTIALAPASYLSPSTQLATVVAISSALDLAALTPTRWIAQGATIAVPLAVEVLNLGTPKANVAVNFVVTNGTASLSASTATTGNTGFAAITAQLTNQNAAVQVSACVAPGNSPCQIFTMFSTPPSLWTLETVSGSSQAVLTGDGFQPLVMRVTDGSRAANPVLGVNVTFETTLAQVSLSSSGPGGGDSSAGGDGLPVILGSSQMQVVTTPDGLASIQPSAGNVGPCDLFVVVSAGPAIAEFQMENLAPIPGQGKKVPTKNATSEQEPRVAGRTVWYASAPQESAVVLTAVSEGVPLPDGAPASPNSCSSAGLDNASIADSSSRATLISGSGGDVATQSCESASQAPQVEAALSSAELPTKLAPAPPADAMKPHHDKAEQPLATPEAKQPSASSASVGKPAVGSLPQETRSCLALSKD